MGAERIVDLLLAAGADPASKTSEGFTAAKVAENCHFPRLRDKIQRADKSKIKKEKQIEKVADQMENVSIFKPNNLIVLQESQPKSLQTRNASDMIADNEEITWALQMKKELEEKKAQNTEELAKKRKVEELEKTNKFSKNDAEVKVKRKTQEEKLRELKEKMQKEKELKENPGISQAEQMVNILGKYP